MIKKLCIIGVGLIGGSLALALKQRGFCARVTGYSRQAAHLQQAVQLGVIDDYSTDLALAVADSDIIVLALPVGSMQAVFQSLVRCVPAQAIVTDVGSVKGAVVEAARDGGFPLHQFVPAHPIAGTEKSGVQAAFAGLYEKHKVIVTPLQENSAEQIDAVTTMWEQTGASVHRMSVSHHDEILSATSHLPHVLAYLLVDCLARMHEQREIFQYAAGGFRDFTRIASSDPRMWVDISLANRTALLPVLHLFRSNLDQLIDAIDSGDEEYIKQVYENAKHTRDHYCSHDKPKI